VRVQETVIAHVFIGMLLMHIPPKYFKMVRILWSLCRKYKRKVKKCFGLFKYIKSGLKAIQYTLKINWKKETRKINYRELIFLALNGKMHTPNVFGIRKCAFFCWGVHFLAEIIYTKK